MLLRKLFVLAITLLIATPGFSDDYIFTETCGLPVGSVSVSAYTGWSNPVYPVFSGNAVVERVSPSSGYDDASGGGNIYFREGLTTVRFMIDWINTKDCDEVELEFGILKLGNGSVRTHVKVETSTDGLVWKNLPFSAEESSGCWVLVESNNYLPKAERLRIRFSTQSSSPRAFRIDDISLECELETVLPVTISSFGVKPLDMSNLVQWNTLSESRIKYYTINRSPDGRNWVVIASVPSRWEESMTNRYQIEDEEIRAGLMYYQLLVHEEDGGVHHPRMVAVMRKEDDEVRYYDMMGNEIKNPVFGRILFRKRNNHIDKIYINYEK
jgi:hypothetical protein